MEFKSSNPVFGARFFSGRDKAEDAMTLQGTINKTYIMFGLLLLTGVPAFFWASNPASLATGAPLMASFGAAILALIVAIILYFKPTAAGVLGPIYALFEGVFVGGISGVYSFAYNGIVTQALILTLGVFFAMLGTYKTGIIQPTERFKRGVVAATFGVLIFVLFSLFYGMMTGHSMITWASPVSIGISVVIVIIAALNLILNFDTIETGVERGAPKYMEWLCAYGLMVTIVWIYLEILRLLAKLRDR